MKKTDPKKSDPGTGDSQDPIIGLLKQALHDGRLVPAFQPIVELKSGKIVAEEALARILTPGQSIIPASAFIDIACALQLGHQVDRAILLHTFAHCAATLQRSQTRTHFVNITAGLMRHPEIVAELLAAATRHCAAYHDRTGPQKPIVIEVTRRELDADPRAAHNMLKNFHDIGIRLALDDFGNDKLSVQHLADLPFSFLKIEGSLIRRVADPGVRDIVQGIQLSAADLGLVTLAEYVENSLIADIIRDIGIDWGQGYHFGRPALPVPGTENPS